ncbi:hypothetical protein CBM2592_B100013 [Cupriavidus taiwanensis]|nr:hypothetical protein CBM2592_B100013 [Cupriavidus taiwanensis]SOY73718.1 hypothetical protein CBM2588_B90015 [Cupriavidus taiwanensis]SOY97798.1 hypothetical protein CBM2591_B80013 [Cupriavidus taiwanensis]SOZ31022.1 hypothetical protein CBM2608_B60278 [Cupriavidus taiwanensis]SOZ93535.1 hypothetical protein CBM2621_B110014 [Cupriavidus taiwanensis]
MRKPDAAHAPHFRIRQLQNQIETLTALRPN